MKSMVPAVGILDIASGELTTVPTDPDPIYATFLPDGEHILVANVRPGSPSRVTRMRIDGSEPQVIVEAPQGLEVNGRPTVSGDGSLLAYTIWDPTARRGPLHIRDLVTGADRIIGEAPGMEYAGFARFSPDARRIAFEQGRMFGDVWSNHVVVVDLATDERVVGDLDFSHGGAIEWSPDGTQVIIMPSDADGNTLPHQLLDPTTGAVTPAPWTSTSYPTMQRLAP
jgi:Tol biopolymer transport system component